MNHMDKVVFLNLLMNKLTRPLISNILNPLIEIPKELAYSVIKLVAHNSGTDGANFFHVQLFKSTDVK